MTKIHEKLSGNYQKWPKPTKNSLEIEANFLQIILNWPKSTKIDQKWTQIWFCKSSKVNQKFVLIDSNFTTWPIQLNMTEIHQK